MKKAFSCKLIILVIIFALSAAFAFAFYGTRTAFADTSITSPSSGFSGGQSIVFEDNEDDADDYVKATVKTGNVVEITKKLVVDDLDIEMILPETVSSLKVTLTYDSYFVKGAYKDQSFATEINNAFTFDGLSGEITVSVRTVDNVISVTVGEDAQTKDDVYYKIKGADKCAATVKFAFTLTEGTETADIRFVSVDQMASDESGAYKQTFKLTRTDDDKTAIETLALPRVAVSAASLNKNENGKDLNAIVGKKYTTSFTVYSLFGGVVSNNLYLATDSEDVWLDPSTDAPKSIIFDSASEEQDGVLVPFEFYVRSKDIEKIESYSALCFDVDSEVNEAPKYIDYESNKIVYEGYQYLVNKAAVKEYTDADGNTVTRSIRLGDSFSVPTLEDLVYDDFDTYANLTRTVYYNTPSSSLLQSSSLSFTVNEAGDYEFFVVFKDEYENSMDKDDFYTADVTDDGERIYKTAVFTFKIEDDAPIAVEVPEAIQSQGYLNARYTATEFKILSGENKTFTLYYNSDVNATADSEGWVKIPALADISEDYDENGFTYADIKAISYNKEYSFTPVKVGAYKIKCYVSSGSAVRFAEGETVIPVTEKSTVVVVPSHWLRDNVWSVVFLSVGTLALIGIIVLLLIKPKEVTETDETGDALKEKAKAKK
ncbi:MAG: hypothetical protein J5911_01205 [Clostridia bacterium]|nr:hypothetical protein [Clostridia bacterium]